MHILSHRGSSLSSACHPIHACAFVRCVVVVLFTRLLFLFVPLLFFRPFQMSSSEFHERLKSKDLRDFRLGTVATSDHETPLTIPLKYIDVSRTTHTNLDVKQEKRIDDYWNIDGSRDLSDYWTGFTQFTLLEENLTDGYMWSGRD